MEAAATGFHLADLINHVHAFDDFTEHAVAPAVLTGVVQEVVVAGVDEELRSGGIGHVGAGHGDGVVVVLQAVVGFVLDGGVGGLLAHAGLEAAALNHEVVNHAMENGVAVKTGVHVVEEVLDGDGGFFGIQLQGDDAEVGVQFNHDGFFTLS